MRKKYMQKYMETFSRRYSKRSKAKFREAIIADFEALGYKSSIHDAKARITKYKNVYVGNPKQAKIGILVPYDTPSKILWPNNKFYPQDGLVNMKKSFFPLYGPLLIGYVIFMASIYASPYISSSAWMQTILYMFSLLYFILLVLFVTRGFSNKHNAQRNSASIVLALELAASLEARERHKVLFIFTDGNRHTKYYGNREVQSYLQEHHVGISIIALHCIGKGDHIGIADDRYTHKGIVKELRKHYHGEMDLKLSTLQEIDKGGTCLEHLKNACMLSSGYRSQDGLYALHTGTSKDNEIDEEVLTSIQEMLVGVVRKTR